METKFNKRLKGKYDTKIISYQNIDNDKGGYVQIVLSTPVRSEYPIVIFPSQLNHWANNLSDIAQIDTDEFIDVLEKLIAEKTEFPLYYGVVSFSADGRRFSNGISFNEPKATPTTIEEIATII